MENVRIFEVGPRDGLQNQSKCLDVHTRVEFIEKLIQSGLKDIEIGSLVHPQWVPQMNDSEDVFAALPKDNDVRYWVLVPNMRGLERAHQAKMHHLCLFVSASEAHNLKNLNATIDKSLDVIESLAKHALSNHNQVILRGYLSMAFGCPFEGNISRNHVADLVQRLFDFGIHEVVLGDTVGLATPTLVRLMCDTLTKRFGTLEHIALHLHDTRGFALPAAYMAYQWGIRTFDGSVGGLGGCPYAGKGAKGNVATEELVQLFNTISSGTNVSLNQLLDVSQWLKNEHELTITTDKMFKKVNEHNHFIPPCNV